MPKVCFVGGASPPSTGTNACLFNDLPFHSRALAQWGDEPYGRARRIEPEETSGIPRDSDGDSNY